MSKNNSFVLSGPKDDSDIPKTSVGKIAFNSLKRRNPESVVNIDAVTGNVLTCQKLLEDSVKLTTVLRSLQLKRGDVIAISSENTLNYAVPVLSGFYMGVAVNLLNPAYSSGELKHALLMSKPKVIFSSEKALNTVLIIKKELECIEKVFLMGRQSEINSEIKNIGDILEGTYASVNHFQPDEFDAASVVALIMLSSGTTGLPKGVQLTHRNMRSPLIHLSRVKRSGFTSEDTTMGVPPFFHLYGLILQFIGIVTGAITVIMDGFQPDLYLRCIQKYKATKLSVVPTMLVLLANNPLLSNYDLSSIKDISCAGAVLGKELEDKIKEKFPKVAILQAYGLTETCGCCTMQPPDVDKKGTLGILVEEVQAKVWDSDGNRNVGPSEVGELCFKGPMIMKGYLGNTTTEDYIDEDGFFHTGDGGYYDKDGFFFLVDRIKELIKYKGFQVSPAELEQLLLTNPTVKDCGIIGIPDEKSGELPFAFVVRHVGVNITEKELVDFVAERISPQKRLYGGVRFIDEIPKTPSGKILRRQLVDLYHQN